MSGCWTETLLCTLQGLRKKSEGRASERGESEDLQEEEEKEDAISEVVRSVYRVA